MRKWICFSLVVAWATGVAYGDEPKQGNHQTQQWNQTEVGYFYDVYAQLQASQNSQVMGAVFGAASESLRAQLQLDDGIGVVVSSVAEEGPAAAAGLQANDVIVSFDEKPVSSAKGLQDAAKQVAGKEAYVEFFRQGEKQAVTVKTKPVTMKAVTYYHYASPQPRWVLGVAIEKADAALRAQLNLKKDEGLVITSVSEGMPAESAGLKPFDVIVSLGDVQIGTVEQLREQLDKTKGSEITVGYIRQRDVASAKLTPEETKQARHVPAVTGYPLRYDTGYDWQAVQQAPAAVAWQVNNSQQTSPNLQQQIQQLTKQMEQLSKAMKELEAHLQDRK